MGWKGKIFPYLPEGQTLSRLCLEDLPDISDVVAKRKQDRSKSKDDDTNSKNEHRADLVATQGTQSVKDENDTAAPCIFPS